MKIRILTEGEMAKLLLSGSLVASSAGELVGHITVLLGCGFKRLLVDMEDVEFMDSLGLHACIAMHKEVNREKGRIVFSKPSAAVNRILYITNANKKLNLAPDSDAGIELLSS